MRTAIEELIELIELKQFECENEFQSGYQLALNDILFITKKFIDKEKQIIENAIRVSYKKGWEEAFIFIKETIKKS